MNSVRDSIEILLNLQDNYEINVTQEHINNGKTQDYYSCPISLAIKEKLKKDDVHPIIKTGHTSIKIFTIGSFYYHVVYTIPDIATYFIQQFDKEKPVHPFSFKITKIKT